MATGQSDLCRIVVPAPGRQQFRPSSALADPRGPFMGMTRWAAANQPILHSFKVSVDALPRDLPRMGAQSEVARANQTNVNLPWSTMFEIVDKMTECDVLCN